MPLSTQHGFMTRPRSDLINRDQGGFYHIVDRCVRRAYLCGVDPLTGTDYSHRRRWIEARLLTLSEIFPIDVYAYAVMSNHYHIVVHYRPSEGRRWPAFDIARRWLTLFPPARSEDFESQVDALTADRERIEILRARLSDLSWYMRCLNEPIARMANHEDDCTGKFWDGRFRSYALESEKSVQACMVYNELNPLRAGMTTSLPADFTSLHRRAAQAAADPRRLTQPLRPLCFNKQTGHVESKPSSTAVELTLEAYLDLVRTTGRLEPPQAAARNPPSLDSAQSAWRELIYSFMSPPRRQTVPRWSQLTLP